VTEAGPSTAVTPVFSHESVRSCAKFQLEHSVHRLRRPRLQREPPSRHRVGTSHDPVLFKVAALLQHPGFLVRAPAVFLSTVAAFGRVLCSHDRAAALCNNS
jgi:hypothetical protein